MKTFKLFRSPLTAFLIFCNLLLALNLLVSCRRDAVSDPISPKAVGGLGAQDRQCPTGFCEFSVTVDTLVDILLCGDLINGTGTCNFNCPGSNDDSFGFSLQANETGRICVESADGQICISQGTVFSVGIRVQFGTSTPINTTLFAGTPLCFNTNTDCTETNAGCN